eukprot:TCONS_00030432-protein
MRGLMKRRFGWKILMYFAFMIVALSLFYYESGKIDNFRINVISKLSTSSKGRINYQFPHIEKSDDIQACSHEINLYIQFVLDDIKNDEKHINDFHNMICSLLKNTECKLKFFILANTEGTKMMKEIVSNFEKNYKWFGSPSIVFLDYYRIGRSVVNYTKPMKELFTTAINTYYSKSLFHLVPGLHRILPVTVDKVIAFDIDILILDDIQNLWDYFGNFSNDHLMALANEQQPVYYHLTNTYREESFDTIVGKPKPHGKPGLNGGVKLFNLESMRTNKVYNSLLDNPSKLVNLADKYSFRGHLGDQDFYTLLSFEYPEWVLELPCSWNRQLCQWWKEYGYRDVFELYSNCKEPYFILHGNCKTKINHTEFHDFLVK